MARYRLLAIVAAATILGACTAGKPASTRVPNSFGPRPAPSKPAVVPPANDVDDLLIVRRSNTNADDTYAVVLAATGEVAFTVPDGAIAGRFRQVGATKEDGGRTIVRFLAGEGGEIRASESLDGSWRLPAIGLAKRPAGISADGRTIVLEQSGSRSSGLTSFAVVRAEGAHGPKVIRFHEDLSFDAISADGAWLYVLNHKPDGSYQVRRIDTATGALDPIAIVDKRSPDEVMSGYAITQLSGRDGWLYTLYQGSDHAFVHALDTVHGGALCIDLPEGSKGAQPDATAAAWGLAIAPDRPVLYAVNSALGVVNELSLEKFVVTRSASVTPQTAGAVLAKFENGTWNDAGSAAVAPDGKVLLVGGPHDVSAVRTRDLAVIANLGGDRGYRSVAVGAGSQVYAVDTAGGLHRLGMPDAATDVTLADGVATIEGVLTLR